MSDSSAWLSWSKPLAATTELGKVSVQSGSTSATVGRSRREAIPVLVFNSARLKMAMPVHSLPVPHVVGQAMWGASGPGIGSGQADRSVDVVEKIGRISRIEIGRFAGVDHRAATDRNETVERSLAGRSGSPLATNDRSVRPATASYRAKSTPACLQRGGDSARRCSSLPTRGSVKRATAAAAERFGLWADFIEPPRVRN